MDDRYACSNCMTLLEGCPGECPECGHLTDYLPGFAVAAICTEQRERDAKICDARRESRGFQKDHGPWLRRATVEILAEESSACAAAIRTAPEEEHDDRG